MKFIILYFVSLSSIFARADLVELFPGDSRTIGGTQVTCMQGKLPTPVSRMKCNYQYSDDACENAPVGSLCTVNNQLGGCVQKDSTGATADCKCVIGAAARRAPGLRCNYEHSDNSCENSTVGAACFNGTKTGLCAQKDSTGETADCKCVVN